MLEPHASEVSPGLVCHLQPGRLYRVHREPIRECERCNLLVPHNPKTNWVTVLAVNVKVVAHYEPHHKGYAKVVVVSRPHVRYRDIAFVHPDCLELVDGPEIVWVKRTFEYHGMAATYVPLNAHERTEVFDQGALDCRWPRRPGEDRFDLLDEATLGAHTGQCYTKESIGM